MKKTIKILAMPSDEISTATSIQMTKSTSFRALEGQAARPEN